MSGLLPDAIIKRTKQPYMAPDIKSFLNGGEVDYVAEMFSKSALKKSGLFDPEKTGKIFDKCRNGRAIGFKDNMAFVGILSSQVLYYRFIDQFSEFTSNKIDIDEEKIIEFA